MAGIGDMDPRALERAVLLVERISHNIEKMTRALAGVSDTVEDVIDTADAGLGKIQKDVQDANAEVDELFRKVEAGLETRVELFNFGEIGAGFDRWLETTDRKMKRWADEMRRHMEARGPFATAGKMTGITSVAGGLGQLKGQLFAGMPFGMGGLLGMALWGAKREEEFAAASRRALFTLQQTGGVARETARGLTGQIRAMYQAWGSMGEEMERTLGAFAEFSIAEEAFTRTSLAAKGFMQNITGVATAVDLMNAAQPGTTARLIGETMLNSSMSIEEASDQVFRLAAGLREAKLNYGLFAAGIVQATSALRVQNQSLDDTAKLFSSLQKRFEEQGMSKQRAAAMALSGVQAATGAIGGLPQGMQGFIAQRLAAKGVEGFAGMKDPFALMVKMQEGLSKGGAFASPVFAELKTIAEKAAGTGGSEDERRLRQIGTLQALGIQDFQAARAIVDGADATAALLSPVEKSAKFTEDLNKAFSTYSNRQSAYERDMRIIQDELAQIGGEILTFLVASGTVLVESIANFGLTLRSVFGGMPGVEELGPQEQQKLVALNRLQMGLGDAQFAALGGVIEKMGKIATVAVDAGKTTVGHAGNVTKLLDTYHKTVERIEGGAPPPVVRRPGGASAEEGAASDEEALHRANAKNSQNLADLAANRKPKGRHAQPTVPRGH